MIALTLDSLTRTRSVVRDMLAVAAVLEDLDQLASIDQAVRESELRLRDARALEQTQAAEREAACAGHEINIRTLSEACSSLSTAAEQAKADLAQITATITARNAELADATAALESVRAQRREFVAALAQAA